MANDPLSDFLVAACVPTEGGHATGTLDRAEAIRAAHPEVASADIYAAAVLGEDGAVRRFLAEDPARARARGGPRGWDALTHLCFSRYLRLDAARSAGFVRAAEALLDAGADPNTGFYCNEHQPRPEFEGALYGAAGVAHHPELTALLLARGANPNDGEVVYHTPETDDNRTMKILVESGRLNRDSMVTLLLRKADWHDLEGVCLLLEHGADPNGMSGWGKTAFQQSLLRDNRLEIIEAMLDHGADPRLPGGQMDPARPEAGKSALALAARRGRGDALEFFQRRGVSIELPGVEQLLAACARNDGDAARSLAQREPCLVEELRAGGGRWLAEFAGNGNTGGVRLLLDLGVAVDAIYASGDGYFGVARNSTALHVAAWRAHHATVQLLVDRGAPIHSTDGGGRTALALAVRACVDSHWKERRAPDSVRALLRAGASVSGAVFPSGYAEVDELLQAHGATPSTSAREMRG